MRLNILIASLLLATANASTQDACGKVFPKALECYTECPPKPGEVEPTCFNIGGTLTLLLRCECVRTRFLRSPGRNTNIQLELLRGIKIRGNIVTKGLVFEISIKLEIGFYSRPLEAGYYTLGVSS
jgi:hypothetical protein